MSTPTEPPGSIDVRTTIPEDCEVLASRLRFADVQELQASCGLEPLPALVASVAVSNHCYSITGPDSQVLAMFGVASRPDNTRIGVVWLLGSDELSMHSVEFLRKSRPWVERLHDHGYPVLMNRVDVRNGVHIRWIHWIGFTFVQQIQNHGVAGLPFYEFVKLRT